MDSIREVFDCDPAEQREKCVPEKHDERKVCSYFILQMLQMYVFDVDFDNSFFHAISLRIIIVLLLIINVIPKLFINHIVRQSMFGNLLILILKYFQLKNLYQ